MNRLPILVVLLVLVSAFHSSAQQTTSQLEKLFASAQHKATVAGDLRGAIDDYKRIVAAAGNDRAAAARALLRMGEAYQKLGDAEAQAVYRRIVTDFADQKDTAAVARSRLSTALAPSVRADVRVEAVLWSGADVSMDVWPLPDGRSVIHRDLSSGNLALRELATGTTRLLTRNAAGEDYYTNPVSSPSGTRIAVRYGNSIRLLSVDGKRDDTLLKDGYEHRLVAWSPDEKYLAAERWPGDGTVTFVLVSTVNGSARQLATLPGGGSLGGFSPDGRHLVYAKNATENPTGGVYLMSTDASTVVPLLESPHQFRDPAWGVDGRHVFFTSNRSGVPSLWSLEIVNGKAAGEPVLREADFNAARFLGFTRDGSLFYGHSEFQLDAYFVDFDPVGLRASNPTPVTEFFVGRNSYPALSPDGRHVAFVRRAGAGPSVVLRTLDSKEERTLMNFQRPYGANTLHWFPDGNALLLTDSVERRKRFRRIDVRTGESTTLFEGPWTLWTGALSPDGTTLYYSVKDDEGVGNRLVKRHLESGAEEEIYRTPALIAEGIGLFGLSVSPSGDRIAFTRNVDEGCPGATKPTLCRLLMIVPSDGGQPRELLRSSRLFFGGPIGWTPDGRQLIVTLSDTGEQHLYAVAADTGEMKSLGIEMPQITSRIVSADGRRIAVTRETTEFEIRAIRNILPARGVGR